MIGLSIVVGVDIVRWIKKNVRLRLVCEMMDMKEKKKKKKSS